MYLWLSTIAAIVMGAAVIFIRMKASERPINAKRIILPPIFMSTGSLMFIFPFFRVSPLQIIEALLVGLLFSFVLIKSSKFEVVGDDIYLKRSKAFAFILIGLLLFRITLKIILSESINVGELSGMFWILAFGMIVPWRISMFIQYKKLFSNIPSKSLNS
ncbi:CcdC family protein [Mangrovibacillus cuniculi]|uniref:Cytochrome c biogenesis protein CcdC n=1 Tax=Mangrovibacillus cuniculi TaxID=2593652 RepID=A0A7S8HF51_9BACI|nr:cytochrome c biogenesis protein CcdC [Mangrovibacillus cuniculi]QPC46448.1 cytochrome c biogenesis protein CcdC [Mangrovibacillus cuniculi]